MRTALQTRPIKKQGIIGRLFGHPDVSGFAIALENALAATPQLEAVDDATIRGLMADHKVRRFSQVKGITRDLIEKLALGLERDDFGGQPEHHLRSLARRLEVPTQTVDLAVKSGAKRLFRAACERAVANGAITSQEAEELIDLRKRIGLDESERISILTEVAHSFLQPHLDQALADARLSPQEEAHLADLAKALGVTINYEQPVVERARRLWQIENSVPPPVAAPLSLQSGEECYAWLKAEALELRERTVSVRYAGPAVRFRIMKGVYYRAGEYKTNRTRESYRHSLGIGPLCVTSKRLVFSSAQKGISIPLNRILECEAYADGIEIRRANGKPLVFLFHADDPFFLPVLNRMVLSEIPPRPPHRRW
jgi:hypothetical protein